MLFILKNQRIDQERNKYILIDTEAKQKAYIDLKPANAIKLANQYQMYNVSSLEAFNRGYLEYEEVESSLFIPCVFLAK